MGLFGRKTNGTLLFAQTEDHWKIALWRFQGAGRRQHPVLLCHGLGANRFNLDAPGENSVARYLQREGFDCWVIELRGAGKSRHAKPIWSRRRWRAERHWSLDDYLHHDLPAAIKKILAETGSRSVHWIGHSMGGMLAYAFLSRYDPRPVRSAVTIGSPCQVNGQERLFRTLSHLAPFIRHMPKLPQRFFVKALSPLASRTPEFFADYFFTPGSIDPALLQKMACLALSDLSPKLAAEFLYWYRTGAYTDLYGMTDFSALLHRIHVPMLLVAGNRDRLAPLSDLKTILDSLGTDDKEILVLSRENGFAHDYGHIDPVLGRDAPREVFPHIRDWISKHDTDSMSP
ncbi:MAG: alpha/beta fold hydrolase [Deltaproteobacteria bacterium]|nr:alpha/beta fold hydrolase [Deltaproteobacteria bacterium]